MVGVGRAGGREDGIGDGVGVCFVEVPGSIPPQSPFLDSKEVWTAVALNGRVCGLTWRYPRLHLTVLDEARWWLVGNPRISASKKRCQHKHERPRSASWASNGARGDLTPRGGDKGGDNAKNRRRRENREIPRDLHGA